MGGSVIPKLFCYSVRVSKFETPVISHNSNSSGSRLDRSISNMSTGELLNIEPLELKFPCEFPFSLLFFFYSNSRVSIAPLSFPYFILLLVELKKQISCSLQLSNKTDSYVAFKVILINFGFLIPSFLPSVFFFFQLVRSWILFLFLL